MTPKFVPIVDIKNHSVYPDNSISGVRPQHRDWSGLFNDPSVGDSLANTMRHWDQECKVDVPFLIVGGGKSIAEVLDSGRHIRFSSPYDGGVVSLITRENKMMGKSFTGVLVIPALYCKRAPGQPIANVSELRSKVNQSVLNNATRSPFAKSDPGQGLDTFRSNWQFFVFAFTQYIDI